ncbi:YkvI family membrane protein [Peptostreptococcus sp. D1]|uniref:YkvI family membrane protein n=1 Tax=Peptostreptococcus sp. D1 TaxID=72304 RepID=UPI0008E8B81F|nr:hypothetical protein [Peptostreptococcus sp. D1]SFE14927.1 Uncharacterized membrane protein YkvI [Peptostreptococcus sp. D1]
MIEKNEKISTKKVINYAGAFIALLIGSGFATGQEILQYFTALGYKGILAVILCFVLLAYVGLSFISAGYNNRFDTPNDIYRYYCGKALGTFYDYFSVFFIFLSYTVMIGGAGATTAQHYNWSPYAGGILMGIVVIITAIFGLNRIVEVIGNIGPVIVVIAIFVGGVSIFTHLDGMNTANDVVRDLVASKEIKIANSNWLLSAGSYVGFCMLWLAAFLGQIGASANSDKEGKLGAFWGATGFSLAVLIMSLGIFFSISTLKGSQIPTLILAGEIHPMLANLFSVIILFGIYTTSVPLLWSVVSRFAEEKTSKFRLLSIVFGIAGMFVGLTLKFDTLVNYVYVLNGYVGLALLFIMIFRSIQWKKI